MNEVLNNDIVTSDLSKFGARERKMAEDILKAWREQGLPENFWDEDVTIAFNTNSGYVFLTNSEYDAAMMNGDKLEKWHNCPECGHEGFKEDMDNGHEPPMGYSAECLSYLEAIGVLDDGGAIRKLAGNYGFETLPSVVGGDHHLWREGQHLYVGGSTWSVQNHNAEEIADGEGVESFRDWV